MNSTEQPGPIGYRFSTITPDDHGGAVWNASILCAIYIFITTLLRFWVKRKLVGLDDWFAAAAAVIALGQCCSVFVALSRGLGQSYAGLSSSEIERVGQAALSSQILFLLSLCLAKVSVILLLRRLSGEGMQTACGICLGICVLWGVASMLVVVINCTPLQVMGVNNNFCSSLTLRWVLIGTIDSVTEVLIIVVPVILVWRLQMDTERKFMVIAAFIPRISLIIFIGLHIRYIAGLSSDSNIGVAFATPMIYQQVELGCSIVSCTVPCLRKFLNHFDTGMGLTLGYTTQPKGSTGRSYQLGPLKSFTSRYRLHSSDITKPRTSKVGTAPVDHSNSSQPNGLEQGSKHSVDDDCHNSIGSQDMIIRKDVKWEVRYN